eukprot:368057_1
MSTTPHVRSVAVWMAQVLPMPLGPVTTRYWWLIWRLSSPARMDWTTLVRTEGGLARRRNRDRSASPSARPGPARAPIADKMAVPPMATENKGAGFTYSVAKSNTLVTMSALFVSV